LRNAYASALTRAFEDGRRNPVSRPAITCRYVEGLLSVMYVGGASSCSPDSARNATSGHPTPPRHRLLCVPTMAVAMVESPARSRYDLSSLNAILCGSAPAPIWLWTQIADDFDVHEIVTDTG